jgi:hypothetical protein
MEKLNLEQLKQKFPEYQGDFQQVSEDYAVGGWGFAQTKKGAIPTITLVRIKDGLSFALFSDQLRMEGARLFASKAHFDKQLARAEAWRAGAASRP